MTPWLYRRPSAFICGSPSWCPALLLALLLGCTSGQAPVMIFPPQVPVKETLEPEVKAVETAAAVTVQRAETVQAAADLVEKQAAGILVPGRIVISNDREAFADVFANLRAAVVQGLDSAREAWRLAGLAVEAQKRQALELAERDKLDAAIRAELEKEQARRAAAEAAAKKAEEEARAPLVWGVNIIGALAVLAGLVLIFGFKLPGHGAGLALGGAGVLVLSYLLQLYAFWILVGLSGLLLVFILLNTRKLLTYVKAMAETIWDASNAKELAKATAQKATAGLGRILEAAGLKVNIKEGK